MKLLVHMAALTRMEYTREVEVPNGTPQSDWDDIARREYDAADGTEFTTDNDYWERGDCWCEEVKDT